MNPYSTFVDTTPPVGGYGMDGKPVSPSDGTTRTGRARAAYLRKILADNPGLGYQDAASKAEAEMGADTNNGASLPDAQEVAARPSAASNYLDNLRSQGQPASPRFAAFQKVTTPDTTTIDMNVGPAGSALPTRWGVQGDEGMAIMKKYEPEAYAAVQEAANRPQVPMTATFGGKNYVGIPRRGVQESTIQRARAEAFKAKMEQMQKDRLAQQYAHEETMAKIPGQGRLEEAKALAEINRSDPLNQARANALSAEGEYKKSIMQQEIEDRKGRMSTRQQMQYEDLGRRADMLEKSGRTKAAAQLRQQQAGILGVPMDAETMAELQRPSLAGMQADKDLMAPTLGELDQDVGSMIGWWDKYGLPGSGSDRGLAMKMYEAALQKLIKGGADPGEAERQAKRVMMKYGFNIP